MHIVFISDEYPLWASGGKGTFIQTFARNLVKAGHNVTVVGIGSTNKNEELQDQGVCLVRLKKAILPKAKYIENWWHINKFLKRLDRQSTIDIVETSELDSAYLPKKTNYKKVIRLHGGHHFFAEAEKRGIDRVKGSREKKSFANADAFIAISSYVKSHTEKYLSYHYKPVVLIPSFLETAIKIPQTTVDQNMILFAGTICEKKGVHQLIQAFKILKSKFPDKELHLYGSDWFYADGRSYIQEMKMLIEKERIPDIIFRGSVSRDDLNQAYSKATVCVFPSYMETQGLVTLEAMLLEKPVIFTVYGPGPETITHGVDGLLCDVYDFKDIVAKIDFILSNPITAREMGKAARLSVIKKFDKNKILQANITFYKQLRKM